MSGLPGRILSWAALAAGLVAGVLLAWRAEGVLQTIGFVVSGAYLAVILFGEFWLAWRMEQAARRDPGLVRNNDIGRRAVVRQAFAARHGGAFGQVDLGGEHWQARSRDGRLFVEGDEVVVTGREGLVLVVAAPGPKAGGAA